MAKSSILNNGFILHCVAVRMAIVGSGDLKTNLLSFDEIVSESLNDTILTPTGNRLVNVLANFREQRMQVEIKLEEFDEYFDLNQILVFIKPSATGYPQV